MVPQISRILLATDLTENSRRAFQYAAMLAERFGATIVMLHVVEKLSGGALQMLDLLMGEGAWQQFQASREENAKSVLIGKRADDLRVRRALAEFHGSTPGRPSSFDDYEIVFREGKIADEVLKAAEERECQVIVMGAHKGVAGTALGSGTRAVLARARVPVLVVPPTAGDGGH